MDFFLIFYKIMVCLDKAVLMGTHNKDFRVFLSDQKNLLETLKRVLLSALRVNH